MKYFEVLYLKKGKKQTKLLKAPSKMDALRLAKLEKLGVVVKVYEVSAPFEVRFQDFKEKLLRATVKQKIKPLDLVASIRQLSVMTDAGISIHDSIKEVKESTQHKYLKSIFEKVDDDLNAGSSFAKSLEPFKDDLGEVSIAMVKLGESTGNMGDSLSKLADILEEIWDNSQKFKKAIRYPITVLIAIIIAFTILMVFVVPKFKDIFSKFKAELPLPTKILLGIENIISNYGYFILAFFIIAFIGIKLMYANHKNFKDFIDKYIFSVYLIGKIIFFSSLSRFQIIFTELVRAGIPISEALDTSLLTVTNTHLKAKLGSVKVSVKRGISLTEAFKDTQLFENMLIQMMKAGESSGNLDAMLEKISEYYKAKFNDIIDNISSYIEPILIGFIAAMVLLMALGIFMPMWDMASVIKG